MAHILIATASPTQRRSFATVLKAARHHVVTTGDAALALAALHESAQPLIVLLDEQLDPYQGQRRCSGSDVLLHALEWPRRRVLDPQRACILLTQQPPTALPARVRARLASGRVALLSPDCTIGELLGAVEDATQRLKISLTSAFAHTVLAIAFQQRKRESACRRRLNNHTARQGQVIISLQRTTSSAVMQLDSARDTIDKTKLVLRNAERRIHLSRLSAQNIVPILPMAHVYTIQPASRTEVSQGVMC